MSIQMPNAECQNKNERVNYYFSGLKLKLNCILKSFYYYYSIYEFQFITI